MTIQDRKAEDLTYGFVGLGLMGGSFAKGIRENILNKSQAQGKIYACDIQPAVLHASREQGVISRGFTLEETETMLSLCDFVFICLYPQATLDFIETHKNAFKPGAIITDISGVKSHIAQGLSKKLPNSVDFICGHPMAGSEKEGYGHASGEIFKDRNYILMPRKENTLEHLEFFKNLVTDLGFTRIIETDPIPHDHKIAFTSQLCHVLAAALVDSAEDTHITAFGGGSFEDLTRIAMINAPLWTELFSANKQELLSHIEAFENSLEAIKKLIQDDNKADICRVLENVREKRIAMSRIELQDNSV